MCKIIININKYEWSVIMKIKYLGTGAAEGIPGLFCRCEYCNMARKNKGKDIRTRSQAIIDDVLLIDYPADSYSHFLSHDIDIANINHLLITHTHEDHLYLDDFGLRHDPFALEINGRLTIYGNDALKRKFDDYTAKEKRATENLSCTELKNFVSREICGYKVTPLTANHDKSENCFIYLIEKDDKSILYGNDTGIFPDETFEFLKGKHISILSLDCTTGKYKEGTNHMGIDDTVFVREKLRTLGCIDDSTKMVITHFSHNGHLSYNDTVKAVADKNINVAYDGFEICV